MDNEIQQLPVHITLLNVPAEARPAIDAPAPPPSTPSEQAPVLDEKELVAQAQGLNVTPETTPTDSTWFREKHQEIIRLWRNLLSFHIQVEGAKKGTPKKIHQAMHVVATKVNALLDVEMHISVHEAIEIGALVHDLNQITDKGIEDLTDLPSTR